MLERMEDFFESRLLGYDEHMLENIEGALEFYKYTAEQLPIKSDGRVLDLGCGTGLELEEYFRINPTVHIVGIDLSKAMLDALKAKFTNKNLKLINGSYFDVPFETGAYDAAVSVESLHHFTESEKLALYEKLFCALKINGYFILTDYFAQSEKLEKKYFEDFQKLKKKQGIKDDGFYHYDTPFTAEHEMEILKRAGFSKAGILKNWGDTYVIRAER